ncbi:lysophospholipid acyltransferase family protein [Marinobacter lutaoensis]|jgi:1-acyl-sn-glycerol-3-phosphate acyltransferase|uniref:lysophospholipid acyltransferase family protein n=1 Tax=Marinobacter lutaoensis TaxID=135739 RepID=UPI000C5794CA|nr:lysophospholipid acyltransferase family protein [Marinobacter lutaoensis]MBI42554.1 glycerol acyltransferase [Oceanospirillales bacterium]NVD37063.1 acyltransferase family protein [Marinobacter lutaoensis]|tara:strand:+ start:1110 stop:1925 length:816 start_codon:yes stop_codon:yes gene_type:complete
MGLATILKRKLIPAEIDEHINRIQKPIGSLGYDPWGYNNEAIKYGFWLTRLIYEKYFRVEAHGVEQVPAEGPVLIIANHSGQLPLDGLLIGYALASRQETPRIPRAMIERFFPTVPWIGNLLNEMGAVLGDPVNCAKMLANGEAVIVFPEGVRGSGKLYRNRYQLKRFGNGFMHLAMKYRAPIVPVGVVGCEETIPAIANIKPLARMLGIPYAPVAMPVVLPAKVHLNFGPPMYFDDLDIPEEQVTERVEQVKAEISRLIDKGLSERKTLF